MVATLSKKGIQYVCMHLLAIVGYGAKEPTEDICFDQNLFVI